MKKSLAVAITLIFTTLLCSCSTPQEGKNQNPTESKVINIVTSFYPIYVDAINIAKDIDGVKVTNLTKDETGCLHDYTLTPSDMKTLETADIFVVNGAGMEAFMDKVIKQQPNLSIIEASQDIPLLKHEDEENAHVWMSVTNSIKQVENITAQLIKLDSEHKDQYQKNADEYVAKLKSLKSKMDTELKDIKNRDIVTFHEAFSYFAQEFDFNIAATIEREPGSEPSPKELEETIDIVKQSNIKALFAEPQYSPKAAETIAKETGAKVYTLDPIVTGDGSPDSYIKIMEHNIKSLKEALNY